MDGQQKPSVTTLLCAGAFEGCSRAESNTEQERNIVILNGLQRMKNLLSSRSAEKQILRHAKDDKNWVVLI